jgi:O-acetyl-ADP-ribose deacetylase (regulator of RNase III)
MNEPGFSCFVIMPFNLKTDADGQAIDFNAIYDDIIVPAVSGDAMREAGGPKIDCVRCDRIAEAGWVHRRMIEHIATADVAVVDLSTLNPNVFYELGVRHALKSYVTVLIERAGTKTQFNLSGMSAIRYDAATPEGAAQARRDIATYVANGLKAHGTDSLVHEVLDVRAGPKALKPGGPLLYRVPALGEQRRLGLLLGDLRMVRERIELWVNSENTQMQMARPFDRAGSAVIRYFGAERGPAGQVVKDLIADELAAQMAGQSSVPPATVLVTGAGRLAERGVKRVLHVAAVQGSVGGGWKPVADSAACVHAVLSQADTLDLDGAPASSILLPLLGTGSGGADLDSAIDTLFDAVLAWFDGSPASALQRVHFQVFDERQLASCRRVLARLQAAPA